MTEHLRYETNGKTAEIILDRPEKRNALSRAMWSSLKAAMVQASEDSSVYVVVIHGGEAGAFAAGADISEFEDSYRDRAAAEDTSRIIAEGVKAVEACPKPVIAAIEGPCVGGGVSIAVAADLRIAGKSARFGVTPGKLGILYSPADTRRLVTAVGQAAAKDLLFTGRIIDADEAHRLKLIDRLADDGQATIEAGKLAADISSVSQWSVRMTKAMVRGLSTGWKDDTPEAMELFLSGFEGEDFREGYRAFLEKRKPDFPFK